MTAGTDAERVTLDLGGPVSEALEQDLRKEVARHGVLVWLDIYSLYSGFVDRLAKARAAGRVPYGVHRFRGSHLELMQELEGVAAGAERVPLVVHLPGFNTESIRATPLLELYEAGVCYRKSLGTHLRETALGRVEPNDLAVFQGRHTFSLEEADEWLRAALEQPGDVLQEYLRTRSPMVLLDDLLSSEGYAASRVAASEVDREAVWRTLAAWIALPTAWREFVLPDVVLKPGDIAHVAASWALCVEYVHDLERAPTSSHLASIPGLTGVAVAYCRAIAEHLRVHHPGHYRRIADETEALLADEVDAARAEDLGRVDTFRFEEDKVLRAALAALARREHRAAAEWAEARLSEKPTNGDPEHRSFWLFHDLARRSTWLLVQDAARLGQAIEAAGDRLERAARTALPHEAAAAAYERHGVPVDRAHRHLEQRRAAHLFPGLPEFEALRARLDELRLAWRAWADGWARGFNALCRAHGFLPPAGLQQRTLFDEVVRPFAKESGTTAYFVVDALRYEMGEELFRQLASTPATNVHLKARFAELPTVTEVGMNVLAPAQQAGKLKPVMAADGASFVGFQAGDYRVNDITTRKRAMQARVGGGTCPWLSLEEVVRRDATSLARSIARAQLVVVHSQEIDEAGESGAGPSVFDTVLRKLEAAWRLLREAGVRRFVITADHGFLLLDDAANGAVAHGRKIDPKRRHVFSEHAADHAGEVRVPLVELGYEGLRGHVMFPESTAVFDTGNRGMSFVHGGNSLQERLIPVLTIVHREAPGSRDLDYAVSAEAREGVAGMHCIEVRVVTRGTLPLGFSAAPVLDLGLRVVDAEGVRVELCQARGARVVGTAVAAPVGETFELFFRLSGATDVKVAVEVHHLGGDTAVAPVVVAERFSVTAAGPLEPTAAPAQPNPRTDWLENLPAGGVRQVFQHLAAHGAVTEGEAATMLGGPRGLRRFAIEFEQFVRFAPFGVRIDVIAGVKRYVRESGR